ncbi:MAG: GTP-binding protein [archaeon]|nr:GTP-binding protein [archaeon]
MEDEQNQELPKIKIIFLGDQSTGKSSILNRFVNDKFDENYQATIGLDFNSKIVKIDNQDVRLLLFDTAGQEKFRSLIQMYTRGSQIILLVYDITRKESFEHIPEWINELTNVKKEEVIFCLVGNKIDLNEKREVTYEEGKKFADENKIIFEEVSAKTGDNFASLFYKQIFDKIITKFKVGENPSETEVQDIGKVSLGGKNKTEDKGKCCKK